MAAAPRTRSTSCMPSMPGYGFSGKPTGAGWGPDRMARAWDVLMKRLGYDRYVAQGGDWGAVIADAMGRQAPPGCSASTSTCRRPCRRRSATRSRTATRRRRACPTRRRSCVCLDARAVHEGQRLCRHDGDPSADARLQPRRFAGRSGRLLPRQVQRVDVQRRRCRSAR